MNENGDLLISHEGQLSKIDFEKFGQDFFVSDEDFQKHCESSVPIKENYFLEIRDKVQEQESQA